MTDNMLIKAGVPAGVVCPMPDAWHGLFKILQPHETTSNPLKNPLILGGWDTPAEMKLERFEEHLEFAVQVGIEKEVVAYLQTLNSSQWFRG